MPAPAAAAPAAGAGATASGAGAAGETPAAPGPALVGCAVIKLLNWLRYSEVSTFAILLISLYTLLIRSASCMQRA